MRGLTSPIVGLHEPAKTTKQTFQMLAPSYYSIIRENDIIEILMRALSDWGWDKMANILNTIFVNEKFSILMKIYLKCPTDCKPTLVHIKA